MRRRRRRLHKACAKEILNKRVNYQSNTIQWILHNKIAVHKTVYVFLQCDGNVDMFACVN